MKYIQSLLLLPALTLATPVPQSDDITNFGLCFSTAKELPALINSFCSESSIMVPSDYASNGKQSGMYMVSIGGDCEPAEWVPTEWCGIQLREVCTQFGGKAIGPGAFETGRWGGGGCQTFRVENVGYEFVPWS